MKITIIFVLLLLLFGCVEIKEETKKHTNTNTNTFCKKVNTEDHIASYFDTTIAAIEEIPRDSTIEALEAQLEASLKITAVDSSHKDYDVHNWVEAINPQIYCVMFSVEDETDFVESCKNNLCKRCQSYLFFYGQKIYFSTFVDTDHYCMNWEVMPTYPEKITLCNQQQYILWRFSRPRYGESSYPTKDIIISLDSQKIDISKEIYSYPLEY